MSVPVGDVGPLVNKFEQVSNDDHQMLVAGVGEGRISISGVQGERW